MDELPADTAVVGLAGAITGDAMANAGEAAEFLDVDVDRLARMLAFISAAKSTRRVCCSGGLTANNLETDVMNNGSI